MRPSTTILHSCIIGQKWLTYATSYSAASARLYM